jgi:DNA-binding Lrp family transcriptional regulator
MDYVVGELEKLPTIEELYEVTGEFDITCLISARDIEEFRDILVNKIMKVRGVKSTVTSIILRSHKDSKSTEEVQANSETARQ